MAKRKRSIEPQAHFRAGIDGSQLVVKWNNKMIATLIAKHEIYLQSSPGSTAFITSDLCEQMNREFPSKTFTVKSVRHKWNDLSFETQPFGRNSGPSTSGSSIRDWNFSTAGTSRSNILADVNEALMTEGLRPIVQNFKDGGHVLGSTERVARINATPSPATLFSSVSGRQKLSNSTTNTVIDQVTKELARLQDKVDRTQRNYQDLSDENDCLRKELSERNETLKHVQSDNDDLSKENDLLKNEKESWTREKVQAIHDRDAWSLEASQMADEIEHQKRKVDKLQGDQSKHEAALAANRNAYWTNMKVQTGRLLEAELQEERQRTAMLEKELDQKKLLLRRSDITLDAYMCCGLLQAGRGGPNQNESQAPSLTEISHGWNEAWRQLLEPLICIGSDVTDAVLCDPERELQLWNFLDDVSKSDEDKRSWITRLKHRDPIEPTVKALVMRFVCKHVFTRPFPNVDTTESLELYLFKEQVAESSSFYVLRRWDQLVFSKLAEIAEADGALEEEARKSSIALQTWLESLTRILEISRISYRGDSESTDSMSKCQQSAILLLVRLKKVILRSPKDYGISLVPQGSNFDLYRMEPVDEQAEFIWSKGATANSVKLCLRPGLVQYEWELPAKREGRHVYDQNISQALVSSKIPLSTNCTPGRDDEVVAKAIVMLDEKPESEEAE
ncbi:hypothetical protein K491DRAFT_718713 [Lophiostoma macrostomum CBS 122681]|uniref:Uncharacterized protein n=1 Tax=Lophiostoma macrostomum CBS 122681 TaxID=1314788 RepID=A0A6A6T1B5_9PLEO|nr:hypothetical protein K491DRAFT_718713 [Lophiostoma macrostomum CBS 122681]